MRKVVLARLGLVVASTLVAMVLLELGVRVTMRDGGSLGSPAAWRQAQLPGEPLVTNRTYTDIGGRRYVDRPIDAERVANADLRILFLGDSFTAGAGLNDLRYRFVERARQSLNERRGQAQRIDTFDAAVGGSMPESWIADYESVAPLYHPQIVVAVFFLRDGTPLSTSYKYNRERFEEIEGSIDPWSIRSHSALARLLVDRWTAKGFSDYLSARVRDSYLGTPRQRKTWIRQQQALRDLASLCRRDDRPLHLVLFPLLFELDNYPYTAVDAEIERFANEADIPFFSLTPGFLGHDASRLWVSPDDQHPNPRGHQIAAETLLPYLASICDRGALTHAAPKSIHHLCPTTS